jgi:uncharacterized protein (DUF1330 family)
MSAYLIVDVEVHDADGYREYQQRVAETFAPFGGRFLVRGGALETIEGNWSPKRLILLQFPTVEQAKAWYHSPEYQAIVPIRLRHATTHFLSIVDGV